jgi:hypothetical protein
MTAEGKVDNFGVMTHANEDFARLWGFTHPDEVVGEPLAGFFKDKQRAPFILNTLERLGAWEGRIMGVRRCGTPFPAFARAKVIRNDAGHRVGLHVFFMDASETQGGQG